MGAAERKRSVYLEALSTGIGVEGALERVQVAIRTLYRWRKEPKFREDERLVLAGKPPTPPVPGEKPLQAFLRHFRETEKLVESCDAAGIELEDLDEARKDPKFAESFARVERRRRQRCLDALYGKARSGDSPSAKAFLDRDDSKAPGAAGDADRAMLDEERDGLGSFTETNGGVQ